MNRYEQYTDVKNIPWTKYVIVVPTVEDKLELEMAFKHIHDSGIDCDYIAVNQLAHEYLTEELIGDSVVRNNIVVDEKCYLSLHNSRAK